MAAPSSSNPPIVSAIPPPSPAGAPVVVEGVPANGQFPSFNTSKGIYDPASAGAGTGTVTSVASGDTSLVVTNPTTTPSIQIAAPNVYFTNVPPAASVPFGTQKATGLVAGAATGEAAVYQQTPAALLTTTGDILYASGANVAARLAAGATAGMVLTIVGGVPAWVLPSGYQFDYVEVTSGAATISATSAATAQAFLQGNGVAYDGATRIKIEYWNYDVNGGIIAELYDGATDLGRIASIDTAAHTWASFIYGVRILTPSAATHTYSINGWKTGASNASFDVGAGGANTVLPMFMRITKA